MLSSTVFQVMLFRNKKCIAVCALKILVCIKLLLAASLINISLAEINKVVFIAYKDSFNVLSFAGRLRKGFWESGVVFFSSLFLIRISLDQIKIIS